MMPLRGFHPIICGVLAGLGLCPGLTGMLEAAAELPPPPPSFVHDDARLFDAATVEGLSRVLVETHRACGVAVYVATSSYRESADTRNQQLVERWLKDQPGLIITYNRGDGQAGVVASPEFWRRHPADEVAQLLADAGRILGQRSVAPEQRIPGAATLIADRSRRLESDRRTSAGPFTVVERRLALVFAGAIALAGCLIAFMRRKTATAPGGPFLFPEAAVNSRLGAQFGGGVAGESSARRPD